MAYIYTSAGPRPNPAGAFLTAWAIRLAARLNDETFKILSSSDSPKAKLDRLRPILEEMPVRQDWYSGVQPEEPATDPHNRLRFAPNEGWSWDAPHPSSMTWPPYRQSLQRHGPKTGSAVRKLFVQDWELWDPHIGAHNK